MTRDPEPRQSGSMSMQDLPGYQEAASSEAFRKAKSAKPARPPAVRIWQGWVAECDACRRVVEPEQGPFKSQQEAAEAGSGT